MARKNKKETKKTKKLIALSAVVCFLAGLFIGAIGNLFTVMPEGYEIPATVNPSASVVTGDGYSAEIITQKELSVHFLELGNKYTGDCTVIKVGNTEVLIDAGSKASSIPTIKDYVDDYCTDGVLEYVIITHAHEDHYAGFATNETTESIFDIYECETVITFSQITSGKAKQKMYQNYLRELEAEKTAGAKHYTALQCVEQTGGARKTYDLGSGVELEILEQKYYRDVAHTENDHSVCVMLNQGTGANAKHYLFTGDLEEDGEKSLAALNDLPQVELYKAGHHGSKTSSHDVLLDEIQSKIVCVCCCAGSSEYTDTNANQFPTQEFLNRVAKHTNAVYVTSLCVDYKSNSFTSMNGNIAVCANLADASAIVYCSNNTTLLKDTDWFKNNRNTDTMPENWKASG